MATPKQIVTCDETGPGASVPLDRRPAARSDLYAALALGALFLLMLAASWQRWTSPVIDHGREMNLPARILAGEQLYQDVQLLYGPFAPYFNALLYRLFGIHLTVLHASGIVCAALILAMIYWLARQLLSAWETALTVGLVLVICALKSTANYVQPYAYAALYGLVFALGSLLCTVRYLQAGGARWLVWAGVGAGLALISKPEIAASALAAAGAALALGSLLARKPLWRDAALFALPLVAIGAAAYGWILSRVPWRVLLEDNYLLFSRVPPQLIYLNRHLSGLAAWPKSLGLAAAGLGTLVFLAGLGALLGGLASRRTQLEWRGVVKRALAAMSLAILWWALLVSFFGARADASPLIAAPLVLPLVIGGSLRRTWQLRHAGADAWREPHLVLVIAAFALISILRVFFNVTTSGPYTPIFVPIVILVCLFLLFRVSPACFASQAALRAQVRRAMMALIALAIVVVGAGSAYRFRSRHTFEVSARRGQLFTLPALGQPLADALRFVQARTSSSDYLLTLPQGTSLNFLAERPYPLREEIVLPGFLTGEKEADAIRRIQARRVPLILVVNLPAPEFRERAFGQDYNQGLMRWIEAHYHLAARFDSAHSRGARLGDQPFFILAYERQP
jgi:hypothetical protein